MSPSAAGFVVRTIEATLNQLRAGLLEAVPKLVSGLVFVVLAYVVISLVLRIVRSALARIYSDERELVASLVVTVVGLFLWFGAALTLLKIVGMGEIAASLGTAAGFIALGVSYALSNMIADTVAGVYLLKDPDFNVGDRVTTDSVTGTVTSVDLRKSRLRLDEGDVVVLANKDIEKKWTRESTASAATDGNSGAT